MSGSDGAGESRMKLHTTKSMLINKETHLTAHKLQQPGGRQVSTANDMVDLSKRGKVASKMTIKTFSRKIPTKPTSLYQSPSHTPPRINPVKKALMSQPPKESQKEKRKQVNFFSSFNSVANTYLNSQIRSIILDQNSTVKPGLSSTTTKAIRSSTPLIPSPPPFPSKSKTIQNMLLPSQSSRVSHHHHQSFHGAQIAQDINLSRSLILDSDTDTGAVIPTLSIKQNNSLVPVLEKIKSRVMTLQAKKTKTKFNNPTKSNASRPQWNNNNSKFTIKVNTDAKMQKQSANINIGRNKIKNIVKHPIRKKFNPKKSTNIERTESRFTKLRARTPTSTTTTMANKTTPLNSNVKLKATETKKQLSTSISQEKDKLVRSTSKPFNGIRARTAPNNSNVKLQVTETQKQLSTLISQEKDKLVRSTSKSFNGIRARTAPTKSNVKLKATEIQKQLSISQAKDKLLRSTSKSFHSIGIYKGPSISKESVFKIEEIPRRVDSQMSIQSILNQVSYQLERNLNQPIKTSAADLKHHETKPSGSSVYLININLNSSRKERSPGYNHSTVAIRSGSKVFQSVSNVSQKPQKQTQKQNQPHITKTTKLTEKNNEKEKVNKGKHLSHHNIPIDKGTKSGHNNASLHTATAPVRSKSFTMLKHVDHTQSTTTNKVILQDIKSRAKASISMHKKNHKEERSINPHTVKNQSLSAKQKKDLIENQRTMKEVIIKSSTTIQTSPLVSSNSKPKPTNTNNNVVKEQTGKGKSVSKISLGTRRTTKKLHNTNIPKHKTQNELGHNSGKSTFSITTKPDKKTRPINYSASTLSLPSSPSEKQTLTKVLPLTDSMSPPFSNPSKKKSTSNSTTIKHDQGNNGALEKNKKINVNPVVENKPTTNNPARIVDGIVDAARSEKHNSTAIIINAKSKKKPKLKQATPQISGSDTFEIDPTNFSSVSKSMQKYANSNMNTVEKTENKVPVTVNPILETTAKISMIPEDNIIGLPNNVSSYKKPKRKPSPQPTIADVLLKNCESYMNWMDSKSGLDNLDDNDLQDMITNLQQRYINSPPLGNFNAEEAIKYNSFECLSNLGAICLFQVKLNQFHSAYKTIEKTKVFVGQCMKRGSLLGIHIPSFDYVWDFLRLYASLREWNFNKECKYFMEMDSNSLVQHFNELDPKVQAAVLGLKCYFYGVIKTNLDKQVDVILKAISLDSDYFEWHCCLQKLLHTKYRNQSVNNIFFRPASAVSTAATAANDLNMQNKSSNMASLLKDQINSAGKAYVLGPTNPRCILAIIQAYADFVRFQLTTKKWEFISFGLEKFPTAHTCVNFIREKVRDIIPYTVRSVDINLEIANIFTNWLPPRFRDNKLSKLCIDRCLKYHPESSEANYKMGQYYLNVHANYSQAESYFDTAFALNEKNYDALVCLLQVMMRTVVSRQALVLEVIRLQLLNSSWTKTEIANLHYLRGLALLGGSNSKEAFKEFIKAFQLNPNVINFIDLPTIHQTYGWPGWPSRTVYNFGNMRLEAQVFEEQNILEDDTDSKSVLSHIIEKINSAEEAEHKLALERGKTLSRISKTPTAPHNIVSLAKYNFTF